MAWGFAPPAIAERAAGPRTAIDLGALPGGQSSAADLNDNGVVVGRSTTAGSTGVHAVRWSRSARITDLGQVDGLDTYALGVNRRGTAFGVAEHCSDPPIDYCSLRWSPDGVLSRLPALSPGAESYPEAMNDSDVVVGYAGGAPDGRRHPVRWTASGQVVRLPEPPGAVNGVATGISNQGLVVGWAEFPGVGVRALLWDRDGNVIELPLAPDQSLSAALGVTEDGLVVGMVNRAGYHAARWQYRDHGVRHPVVLDADSYLYGMSRSGIAVAPGLRWDRSGRVTELDRLHDIGSALPAAVNDAGIVVGVSGPADGTATPVWWDREGTPHELPDHTRSPAVFVRAVNEAGAMVGQARFPGGQHAALWR
ncbi:hypothetical protein V5P93_003576 [Actinokineospora auranticolor]|nr:hypothetical protein [Actinokineospora auranticolor]